MKLRLIKSLGFEIDSTTCLCFSYVALGAGQEWRPDQRRSDRQDRRQDVRPLWMRNPQDRSRQSISFA
jgi:hypothetical protein